MWGRIVIAGGFLFSASVAWAETPGEAIASLVNDHWKPGSKTAVAANLRYQELLPTLADDARLHTAQLLVCLQQRAFSDAAAAADRVLGINADASAARRAQIWLSLLRKEYAAAQAAAEDWAPRLAKQDTDSALREQALNDAEFLGAVYGFLAGPVSEQLEIEAADSEKKVLALLTDDQRASFRNARQNVVEKHVAILNGREDAVEKQTADAEATKAEQLEKAEKRAAELKDAGSSLENEKKGLTDQYKEKLDKLDKSLADVSGKLTQVQLQSQTLLAQRDAALAQYSSLQAALARLNRQKDPSTTEIRNVESQLRIVDAQVSGLEARLNGLVAAAAQLTAQGNQLQQQRSSLIQQGSGEIKAVEQKLKKVAVEEKKNEGAKRLAGKGASPLAGKSHALALKAAALSTYLVYPLESEKLKLLTELRSK